MAISGVCKTPNLNIMDVIDSKRKKTTNCHLINGKRAYNIHIFKYEEFIESIVQFMESETVTSQTKH